MLAKTTHPNGVTEPGRNGSAVAPHSKNSCPKPGEFLALKSSDQAWSWHGAKPKNRYESTAYNATELKRRAANYSGTLRAVDGVFETVLTSVKHQRYLGVRTVCSCYRVDYIFTVLALLAGNLILLCLSLSRCCRCLSRSVCNAVLAFSTLLFNACTRC